MHPTISQAQVKTRCARKTNSRGTHPRSNEIPDHREANQCCARCQVDFSWKPIFLCGWRVGARGLEPLRGPPRKTDPLRSLWEAQLLYLFCWEQRGGRTLPESLSGPVTGHFEGLCRGLGLWQASSLFRFGWSRMSGRRMSGTSRPLPESMSWKPRFVPFKLYLGQCSQATVCRDETSARSFSDRFSHGCLRLVSDPTEIPPRTVFPVGSQTLTATPPILSTKIAYRNPKTGLTIARHTK